MSDTTWMVPGALAEYAPVGPRPPWFPCVIDGEPFTIGSGHVMVRLRDLSPMYALSTGRKSTTVPAASVEHVRQYKV